MANVVDICLKTNHFHPLNQRFISVANRCPFPTCKLRESVNTINLPVRMLRETWTDILCKAKSWSKNSLPLQSSGLPKSRSVTGNDAFFSSLPWTVLWMCHACMSFMGSWNNYLDTSPVNTQLYAMDALDRKQRGSTPRFQFLSRSLKTVPCQQQFSSCRGEISVGCVLISTLHAACHLFGGYMATVGTWLFIFHYSK